jgi:hypothetical protein
MYLTTSPYCSVAVTIMGLHKLTVPYSFAIEGKLAVWSEITYHDRALLYLVRSILNICSS